MPRPDPVTPPCVLAEIDQDMAEAAALVGMYAGAFRQLRAQHGHDDALSMMAAVVTGQSEEETQLMLLSALGRLADAADRGMR